MFKKISQWWRKRETHPREYMPLGNTFAIAAEAGWIMTSPTDFQQSLTTAFRNGEISTYGIASTNPRTGERKFTDIHCHAEEFSKWLVVEVQKHNFHILH